jgi:ubiquinone/menaquinone biosynthesis C-methylase UbiE
VTTARAVRPLDLYPDPIDDQSLSTVDGTPEIPERFDPATMQGELLEAEHLARYRWVAELAQGRRVLDAGCGTAYGAEILAQAGAEQVVGVDCAADVLDSVRPRMPETVLLETGDVTALAHEDDSFDLVVCFEVIEHLEERGRALDEFRRVLRPQGILAISSPNRDVYPAGNPHHVHEYTPAELEQELSSRFDFTSLRRQHTWITTGVLDDEQFQLGDDVALAASASVRKLVGDRPGSELYTIALAGQLEPPTLPTTFELATQVELRKWDELWHEQAEVLDQQRELLSAHERVFAENATLGNQLYRELDQLRSQLLKTESELARMPELDAQLRDLLQVNDELLALNHELQRRQLHIQELEATAARYTVVVQSSSWKLTRPMRRLAAALRRLTR